MKLRASPQFVLLGGHLFLSPVQPCNEYRSLQEQRYVCYLLPRFSGGLLETHEGCTLVARFDGGSQAEQLRYTIWTSLEVLEQ